MIARVARRIAGKVSGSGFHGFSHEPHRSVPNPEVLQQELERLREKVKERNERIAELEKQVQEQQKQIGEKEKQIGEKEKQIADLERQLALRTELHQFLQAAVFRWISR